LETGCLSFKEAQNLLPKMDWVVQATSVGLKGNDTLPISLKGATQGIWVMDLIYHRETAFLKQARMRKLLPLNGLEMLLHQGALSLEYWTGRKSPLDVMRKVLRQSLHFQ
jgi:shikimate dehydrogenase